MIHFVLGDILSLGTFCPWGHFVLGDILSLGIFCPWGYFVLGNILSGDILSGQNVPAWLYRQAGTFCPDKMSCDKTSPFGYIGKQRHFVRGSFCDGDILSWGRFVMGAFCLGDILSW